ncbi:MAG: DEAD/DEAH box helicase [Verrucomicrobia bacterium]|nr:DEAD/DEAH box helicase [Verrucomicrobiota bacterium]
MQTLAEQLENAPALNQVVMPDLWQQQAIAALREGLDVVVQAPTGAGKTLIFEHWSNQGRCRGQAIYTVPTRALANDKLAEWRARGWNVGIATGDLAENLEAPVLVATLETQKNRLIQGDGPSLLVVDEYQMIADPDRGLNYELALALAPAPTQLLLLSGSVANPQDLVKWLLRLGRKAVLIRTDFRPVPQEEVFANTLSYHLPPEIRNYWPRLVAKALAENLGPVLVFAPRRQATEALAAELARQLPCPNPLVLTAEQKQLVGEHLAKLLKARVAFHHSGLSYGARAGVVEPLAKAGQLRVVVATMGLAAGINFSLRSVALAGESYRRDHAEQPLRSDEILQMFGRAGRRGIDDTGYVLVSANEIRLRDGYPVHLARSGLVDWSALLSIMHEAAAQGRDPFAEAVRVQQRLFTSKPVVLGVEESLRHPDTPCGLKTDAERARHVRKRVHEMLNSRGEWEPIPAFVERALKEIVTPEAIAEPRSSRREEAQTSMKTEPPHVGCDSFSGRSPVKASGGAEASSPPPETTPDSATLDPPPAPRLLSVLTCAPALEKVGHGALVELGEQDGHKVLGRAITVAELLNGERVLLAKWIRRLTNWQGRQTPMTLWQQKIVPLVEKRLEQQKLPVARFETQKHKIVAVVSLTEQTMRVPVDRHGVALWKPTERDVFPPDCAMCPLVPVCRQLPPSTGTAMLWRRLGLVDAGGVPTRRGRIVSFFSQGDGLAIAAGLEEESFPLDEMVYELANLDAGFRFCAEESRWAGRLAMACQKIYGLQDIPGYLEGGVPIHYGAGAEEIVAHVHKNPNSKHAWTTEWLGVGDIDRVIIEWRSTLRQIAHAPPLEWARWTALQAMAKGILLETESPTITDLPPLDYHQTRRMDHQLVFRRH